MGGISTSIKRKKWHNKYYVQMEREKDKNFKITISVGYIVGLMNAKYGVEGNKKVLSRTRLN